MVRRTPPGRPIILSVSERVRLSCRESLVTRNTEILFWCSTLDVKIGRSVLSGYDSQTPAVSLLSCSKFFNSKEHRPNPLLYAILDPIGWWDTGDIRCRFE